MAKPANYCDTHEMPAPLNTTRKLLRDLLCLGLFLVFCTTASERRTVYADLFSFAPVFLFGSVLTTIVARLRPLNSDVSPSAATARPALFQLPPPLSVV
jgi:hypothetical protein